MSSDPPKMLDDLPTALPASKLGEYTVIGDIAEGTFGVVKMAIHTVTGHKVAMKYISKAAIHREKTKTRVRREYEYMRSLRHPHIIKLYEVISTPTDIIFVLEYAGGELFDYIVNVSHGRMPEPQARRFFQQIISGVEHSHRLKIVHRDLKPENVLLDDDLNVKIADFGLSNEISDGDFLSTSCGSPNYAAPEVIRGAVYAGPEIDVWSAGIILYVMLCGHLPFEDDNVQILFTKISQGTYHLPTYLSPDALDLITRMLAVDPVQRITIPEITLHPFFLTDLPNYLKPIPAAPAVVGTLSALVSPPPGLDFEIIEGLGRIEVEVVDDLAARMSDIPKEEVWECLRRDDGMQGNTVKVAYMLLRDKRRLGKDLAGFAEQERDAQIAAMDPRIATSPGILSPEGGDPDANPFEAEFNADYPDSGSELSDSSSFDEDDEDFFGAPAEPEVSTYAILDSSLPPSTSDTNTPAADPSLTLSPTPSASEPHHLSSYASASARRSSQAGASGPPKEKKPHRTKWHFGIRSRSPPMEIMLEIYKTLKVLGMEWKEKRNLGGLGGVVTRVKEEGAAEGEEGSRIERVKRLDGDGVVDLKAASGIYFVETRARVQDVVVLMNLQLYMVDSLNYLVDFHHKGTYRASSLPGAGTFDMADPASRRVDAAGGGGKDGKVGKVQARMRSMSRDGRVGGVGVGRGEEDVMSPFVFMDVACKLILELAGGG